MDKDHGLQTASSASDPARTSTAPLVKSVRVVPWKAFAKSVGITAKIREKHACDFYKPQVVQWQTQLLRVQPCCLDRRGCRCSLGLVWCTNLLPSSARRVNLPGVRGVLHPPLPPQNTALSQRPHGAHTACPPAEMHLQFCSCWMATAFGKSLWFCTLSSLYS